MRNFVLGVAMLWVVMALALTLRLSFASVAANGALVFITLTAGVSLLLAWARRIPHRAVGMLATVVLSGAYLLALCVLGWAIAFDPWAEPDMQVRQDGRVCRLVYYGQYAQVQVSETYPWGIERFKRSYLVDGSPATIDCGHG